MQYKQQLSYRISKPGHRPGHRSVSVGALRLLATMDDRRKGFGGLPRGGTCRDRAGAGLHLATIHPNEFSDGRVEDAGNWAPNREGEVAEEDREEEWRQRMETAEVNAKVALAGPLANMKYQPTMNGEYFADFRDLSDVATYLKIAGGFTFEVLVPGKPLRQNNREASLLWEALQRDTAELIELHWPDIERVTEALLLRGELGEKETPAATTSVSSGSTVQRQKS